MTHSIQDTIQVTIHMKKQENVKKSFETDPPNAIS